MTPSLHRGGAFADTSALYALFDQRDGFHSEAIELFKRVSAARAQFCTTTFVVAETHALMLSRMRRPLGPVEARRRSREALGRLYEGMTTIVRPTEDDERAALALLARFDDQDFSFTDATSFAVMRRLGIELAFTFDDDFTRAGFTDLRHL